MHEEWTDRLSELLDGELSPLERAAVERHLEECEPCARVLDELRVVVSRASHLGDRPPRDDLWPEIEARIRASRLGPRLDTPVTPLHARRLRVSVPQLVAASVALVAISAGTVWLAMGQPGASPTPQAAQLGAPAAVRPAAAAPGEFGETSLAIAELERTLAASRTRLDPETLRVIDENLALIDAAIAEVQEALNGEPGNVYLNLHMADTMRRKLQLLRELGELAASAQ